MGGGEVNIRQVRGIFGLNREEIVNNPAIVWGSDVCKFHDRVRESTAEIMAKLNTLSEVLRASRLVPTPAENLWGAAALLKDRN